jgi:hypothetical protein
MGQVKEETWKKNIEKIEEDFKKLFHDGKYYPLNGFVFF